MSDGTYNNQIQERILSYLDGWTVFEDEDYYETELRLDTNKIVTSEEIETQWKKACLKISTYLYVETLPSDERIVEETCQYTAGLLFKKYTVSPNDNYEDNNPNTGYSNYLINNALKNLEPFRSSIFSAWTLR